MGIAQLGDLGGGPVVTMGVIVLLIAIVLAYWVYKDAESRGKDNALIWGLLIGLLTLFTLVGGIVAFVVYLLLRD